MKNEGKEIKIVQIPNKLKNMLKEKILLKDKLRINI
jgi:hypothetical protein